MHSTDDTIDKFERWFDAEQEGRLVELPCKTVFLPVWDAGEDCDLSCPDSLDGESRCDTCKMAKLNIYERLCTQEDIGQIGKTVFLTREAAEAELREGENNEADT